MLLVPQSATFLATLLLAISWARARPLPTNEARAHESRTPAHITLPLTRLHDSRATTVHPEILLQQHINRGHRRLANLAGRQAPSDSELADTLLKRLVRIGHAAPYYHPEERKVILGSVEAALKPLRETVEASKSEKVDSGTMDAASNITASAVATSSHARTPTGGISPIDVEAGAYGGLTKANPPSANDSLGLDIDANDVGYVATVSIGTPSRDFLVVMDSGSADFWVAASDCATLNSDVPCSDKHQSLGETTSSSFIDTRKAWAVGYGTGEVAGHVVRDDVSIAGLLLNNHTFGTASIESTDFSTSQTSFDGLMGLAYSALSGQGVQTPVESLFYAGLIDAPIVSFKLSRLADQLNDGGITFGGLDSSKFQSDTAVTLDNVNAGGFWEAAMDGISVDGTDLGLVGRTAILDTGTTLIIAPANDTDAVHALIPGAKSDGHGGYTLPCTSNVSVALSFGGREFAIDTRDMLFAPVNPNDLTGECYSGISSGQIGGPEEWLVGDVFLKNAYFSVNEASNTIQLAKLT